MPESLFSKLSVGSILGAVFSQATAMFRYEIELAKAEVSRKLKGLGVGAGLVGFAFGLIFVALVLLIIAGVAALTIIWDLWLAALVAGSGVLLIALIFLGAGIAKIKKNKDLRPERAVSALKAASKYFD